MAMVHVPRAGEKRRRENGLMIQTAKRTRFLSDFDLEEMLYTLMTISEDLALLLNLSKDICQDKHCCNCNPSERIALYRKLKSIETALSQDERVSLPTIQSMCKDMYDVLKYLLEKHYTDFVKLGMDHLILAVRHQFVQYMMDYSLN
ncbi:hypothetical protein THRCLA_21975 [Thraustotheca clavata]|uniref:Uncharacterized protein n=1 Tax=Thraustotheca clavata TaxID=74557 RepID=A0A1V9ZFZ2_9STRA|nr:hypothetical protein THRCLA_21975 [Thraustotheca clavata]